MHISEYVCNLLGKCIGCNNTKRTRHGYPLIYLLRTYKRTEVENYLFRGKIYREKIKEENILINAERKFGDLILNARKEKKLSLQKLSDEIKGEITPSYINRLEKNEKLKPSFDVVCQLTTALELELTEVFESFGYGTMYCSGNRSSKDLKMSFETKEGIEFSKEVNTFPNQFSTQQTELLRSTIEKIVGYATADSEREFGYLPDIIRLVEEFRNKVKSS